MFEIAAVIILSESVVSGGCFTVRALTGRARGIFLIAAVASDPGPLWSGDGIGTFSVAELVITGCSGVE